MARPYLALLRVFEMGSRHAATASMNTSAVSFTKRMVDSNRATRSHTPEDWTLHQHRCGIPKSRVNPMFAGRQLQ